MQDVSHAATHSDHGRIGSLETHPLAGAGALLDHCRIGSLEMEDLKILFAKL